MTSTLGIVSVPYAMAPMAKAPPTLKLVLLYKGDMQQEGVHYLE